ncbi:MAG TPA: YSC84-related protein [Candidatus Omnitrophota bacterium]|nr:YSC84-related protein [Candidatus Omnitrophota bacterium]
MKLSKFMALLVCGLFFFSTASFAKSAREIDASVDTALTRFQQEVPGAKQLIDNSKGMLVFPSVIKAGIGIGGEYGTGALLQKKTKQKEYYNIVSGSFGFQLGGQVRTVYMLFMNEQALAGFRNSEGWKAGVDGSVAVVNVGANGQVDTATTNQPIIAFVLGQKGLMYNLTLEGSKFNRIYPEQ